MERFCRFRLKLTPLTPCCDFRCNLINMIFFAKHPQRIILFGILTSKLSKTYLTSSKLTNYAKVVDFTLFSIVFYRKGGKIKRAEPRTPGTPLRGPILCMEHSIGMLDLWLKSLRGYICGTLNVF